MIKLLLLTLLVWGIVAHVEENFLDNIRPVKECGHDAIIHSPAFLAEHGAGMEEMNAKVRKYLSSGGLHERATQLIRIPVVWHVLHQGVNSPSYVSRDQILLEMQFLNNWYSTLNPNFNTTDLFSADVARSGDLMIRWELAAFDPQGNPTNGIRYVQSSLAESCSSSSTANFYTANGGDDMWTASRYFNIYTCNIVDSGVAGYAYLPSSRIYSYEGCVLDYGQLGDRFYSGSTLAHEAGHWLGLKHTFDRNDCAYDDGVDDTPNTNLPASNWVPTTDPCNLYNRRDPYVRCTVNNPNNLPVMVRNIMDYNYEQCQSYFSKGQAAVMRWYLTSPDSTRYTLQNTNGVLNPTCSTYNCYGKTCGSDGCGGTCGECPSLYECRSNQCVAIANNDDCTRAEELPQTTAGYTVTKNNTGVNNNSPTCDFSTNQRGPGSLWYRFTAVASGTATVSLAGSTVDTIVSILRIADCASGPYQCVYNGFDDNSGGGVTARLQFSVQSGVLYYVVPAGKANARGLISLTMTMSGTGFPNTVYSASTPSPTPSVTRTRTPTPVASSSPSPSPSRPASVTPSRTPPASASPSVASSASRTPTPTPPASASRTPSTSRVVAPSASRSPAASPVCNAQAECTQRGLQCGTAVVCNGVTYNCGQCSADRTCVSNTCQCPLGTFDSNGNCVKGSIYSQDFRQVPTTPAGFSVTGADLVVTTDSAITVVWNNTRARVAKYSTREYFRVTASTGTVAFACYHGSGAPGYTNDRIEWRMTGVNGASATVNLCLVYGGRDYCNGLGLRDFPTSSGLDVIMTMGYDDVNRLILWNMNFGTPFDSANPATYLPQNQRYQYSGSAPEYGGSTRYYTFPGDMAIYSSGSRPKITNWRVATSTVLTVTLNQCINDADWKELFYSLTGADRSTTDVTIVGTQGQTANCKDLEHGKALISSIVFTVSSVGVPAPAIADVFLAAAAGPAGASIGATSASVVAGSQGAAIAGFPAAAAAGGATAVAGTLPGAAAGGAGGGGLSAGAIVGIVLGSVAGGVILIGVTGILIAAAVLAAVMISRRDSDEQEAAPSPAGSASQSRQPSPKTRPAIRRTLQNMFGNGGGVDVMNNPQNKPGHVSITARTPARDDFV